MSENAPDQNTQDTTPTFAELGIDARVLAALEAIGYEKPSPIQEATIPVLLEGRDVVGMAQTGTGKTAAFAVPALSRLAELADLNGPSTSTQVLVLAPTRELALQVGEAFASYAVQLEDFTVLPVYGGSSYGPQLAGLRRGAQVVVGTPGRVIDHLKRGSLKLDDLQYLVLDEADEMLRMGFAEDVETILSQTPEDKQVALFSATMPLAIRKIAQRYLRNPEEISVKAKTSTATNIRQRYLQVMGAHKLEAMTRLLEVEEHDVDPLEVAAALAVISQGDQPFFAQELPEPKRKERDRGERSERGGRTPRSEEGKATYWICLLYTSPSPRDRTRSRMPSSA